MTEPGSADEVFADLGEQHGTRLYSQGSPQLGPSQDRSLVEQLLSRFTAAEFDRDRLVVEHLVQTDPTVAFRTARPGHLTGSEFVVNSAGTHALLLFHRKLQRWLQPGGHADGDCNLAAVALKEATEESGIVGLRVDPLPLDLDIHVVAPPREDRHLHLDVRFLVVAPEGAEARINDESEGFCWLNPEQLAAADVDEGLRRLATAGFERFAGHEL